MNATSIAASGLAAATTRMVASASNVANMDVAGTPPDEPPPPVQPVQAIQPRPPAYRPARVVLSPEPHGGVSATVERVARGYPAYSPGSAAADADGMVVYPDVDLARETVEQVSAMAAFHANLSMLRTVDEMERALIDTLA